MVLEVHLVDNPFVGDVGEIENVYTHIVKFLFVNEVVSHAL